MSQGTVSGSKKIIVFNTSDPDESNSKYYYWSIYIKTDPLDYINEINEVVYHLHPTFPKREVSIKQREEGFRLYARGWGEFPIRLDLIHNNGKRLRLNHQLGLFPDSKKDSEHSVNESDFS